MKYISSSIRQKKDLTLPLLSEVGEAIIDYVQYARPQSTHKEIFLSNTRPYRPITACTYSGIVDRYLREAGINSNMRQRGMHSLRHSLATTLMNNGISLDIISDTLGHQLTSFARKGSGDRYGDGHLLNELM